jgi:hypothetical protein
MTEVELSGVPFSEELVQYVRRSLDRRFGDQHRREFSVSVHIRREGDHYAAIARLRTTDGRGVRSRGVDADEFLAARNAIAKIPEGVAA